LRPFVMPGQRFAGEDVPRRLERLVARSVQCPARRCAHGVPGQHDDASSSASPLGAPPRERGAFMLNWFQALQRTAFEAWSRLTRRGSSLGKSGVLLHDPAASSPHDLDDPFLDPVVQSRVATMIAGAAQKKANEQD
jgi:hypothetical protein